MTYKNIKHMLTDLGYTETDQKYRDYIVHTRDTTTFFTALHSMINLKMGGLMALNVSKKSSSSIANFFGIIKYITKFGVEVVDIGGVLYVIVIKQENRI